MLRLEVTCGPNNEVMPGGLKRTDFQAFIRGNKPAAVRAGGSQCEAARWLRENRWLRRASEKKGAPPLRDRAGGEDRERPSRPVSAWISSIDRASSECPTRDAINSRLWERGVLTTIGWVWLGGLWGVRWRFRGEGVRLKT